MDDNTRIVAAASRAEELAAALREAAEDIRGSNNPDYAYAQLYRVRYDLGKVVATLGEGYPGRRTPAKYVRRGDA